MDYLRSIKGNLLSLKWRWNYPYGIPEMGLLKKIIHPSDAIIDAGANIGSFTYFLSTTTKGNIHCFEPQNDPFQVLKGVSANLKNVYCHKMGLSSSSGWTKLYIPIVNDNASYSEASLDPEFNMFTGPDRKPKSSLTIVETVMMTTLDDFLIKNETIDTLDFVKIDVEGHELEVLKGSASVCLKQHRPIFFIEIFPYVYEGHFKAVCDYLANHEYNGYVISRDRTNLESLSAQNVNNSLGYNYFFVPDEKTDRIARLLYE